MKIELSYADLELIVISLKYSKKELERQIEDQIKIGNEPQDSLYEELLSVEERIVRFSNYQKLMRG